MIRYRIARDPKGRHIVLPAWIGIVPLEETYATRQAAGDVTDWLNSLTESEHEWTRSRSLAAAAKQWHTHNSRLLSTGTRRYGLRRASRYSRAEALSGSSSSTRS